MAKKNSSSQVANGQTKYVAYYRVSTRAQGESGLGLEAQRSAVAGFVKGAIIAEYTEVESGKNNQRVQLAAAIDRAKREGAVLVIAKLDRLSRNASFIFTLRDSGVNFQCVDMPDANTLTIGIFATLAQHERELISSRTRSALQAKIAQGAQLGKPENLTPEAQAKGTAANVRRAALNENNRRATSMAIMMLKAGKNFSQIAYELNQAGFRTSQGCEFQATQVMRLIQRTQKEATV
ncbi:recombinase family protein [Spirosoma sp. 48-14]|uniref:recombinase family protein n=1 Tax=Spirosoma sp. 48-14 TaxID=1895854 RepID=UPI0009686CDB|nr:recombinase family protein [Spirosoma sp. 48-14]OJW75393.1 MAG: resolvase [Spirosoma sp. 48-14]